jgi:hypothetical protein
MTEPLIFSEVIVKVMLYPASNEAKWALELFLELSTEPIVSQYEDSIVFASDMIAGKVDDYMIKHNTDDKIAVAVFEFLSDIDTYISGTQWIGSKK